MAKNTFRALAALSLSLVLGLARAQDGDNTEGQDPPDRAARLSYLSGDVSMQPAGEDQWAPAMLNRPLTTGDKLWTERNARAEIQVGPAAVRLGDQTGFSFLNVDDDTIQMRMTAGVLYVNVRYLDGNDHVEVDTPNIAVSILRPGSYRVEVNDAGDASTVKISEGEAEIDGPGQNVVVHAQQSAVFRGDQNLAADWGSLGSPDEFDRWNLERDRNAQRLASSRTAEYVAPEVTGYQDLEGYGSWSSEPEYGYVWTPTRVAVDWSPYRFGRWVWISPWGWTWIDDSPWGYAPFHYGRWAHVRDRWCWVPGPRHVRAVYAPALVGWVGSPGVSVSVTVGGGVGWFPLGPREVYVPARRFSNRYVERVNVTNTVIVNRTVINNVYVNGGRNVDYRNRHVPGGFTAVSRNTFVNAGRVGDRGARLDEREFARANVSAAPQIQPGRESRLGGSPRDNNRAPPRAVVERQVIVKRDPPAAAARFTRGRSDNADMAQRPTERFQQPAQRPQDRNAPDRNGQDRNGQDRNARDRAQQQSSEAEQRAQQEQLRQQQREAQDRNRADRPGRGNPQPSVQPNVQPNVTEPRETQERPRDDRPPKDRNGRGDDRSFQRQREMNQQQQQGSEAAQRAQQEQQRQEQRQQQQRDSREQQQRQMQERDSREQQQRQMQEREQQQRQMQERQSQEREQQQRQYQQQQQQQQERQRAEQQQRQQQQQQPRNEQKPRAEPKQDDKPRRPRNDDDNSKPQRQ